MSISSVGGAPAVAIPSLSVVGMLQESPSRQEEGSGLVNGDKGHQQPPESVARLASEVLAVCDCDGCLVAGDEPKA